MSDLACCHPFRLETVDHRFDFVPGFEDNHRHQTLLAIRLMDLLTKYFHFDKLKIIIIMYQSA